MHKLLLLLKEVLNCAMIWLRTIYVMLMCDVAILLLILFCFCLSIFYTFLFHFVRKISSGKMRQKFELPEIEDNLEGWGPLSLPPIFSNMPYQDFCKTDELGKVSKRIFFNTNESLCITMREVFLDNMTCYMDLVKEQHRKLSVRVNMYRI